MIESVIRDTETRTSRLDFLPAVSARALRTLLVAFAAAGLLVLVLSRRLASPGQFLDFAEPASSSRG